MAGTYEYNLNAVVGKLHDAAKANADKKVNSFIAGLKRMRLEFGDGDVLDNTGISEDKKGSMYRGPGRYEIRFIRGGHGTMKRFKDYMKEYMKWFAGIDDFDVEDYIDEDDDGEERFYTVPYEFVEGKFQANDKVDGEGDDFGQLEPISDDEEGSDGPDEKDGGEKVSREEVAKMIAQKLLDRLGDKNLKIDDLLRTSPTAKDFAEMGVGDEKNVEAALGSKTKDEAAENVEKLDVNPDKDKVEAAAGTKEGKPGNGTEPKVDEQLIKSVKDLENDVKKDVATIKGIEGSVVKASLMPVKEFKAAMLSRFGNIANLREKNVPPDILGVSVAYSPETVAEAQYDGKIITQPRQLKDEIAKEMYVRILGFMKKRFGDKLYDQEDALKKVLWYKSDAQGREELRVLVVFVPYGDMPSKEGEINEERPDMKNETSKMVKAVMEKKFSDARESLKKILEAKVAARKASIKAE